MSVEAEGKYLIHVFGQPVEPDPEVLKGYEELLGGDEKLHELFRQATAMGLHEQYVFSKALMNRAHYLDQLKLYEKMLRWPEWVIANYNLASISEGKDGTIEIYCRPKDKKKEEHGLLVMEQKGDQIKVVNVWPPFKGEGWLKQFSLIERITKFFRRVIPS